MVARFGSGTFAAFALLFAAAKAGASVTWDVTVNDSTGQYSALAPTLVSHAQLAGATWTNLMTTANVTLSVEIDILDVSSNRGGGQSATTSFLRKTSGISIYEQGATHELRTGNDPNGSAPDIVIQLDPDYINTQMWFDPDPITRSVAVPNNRIDDMSVFLHELGHAFGMDGWRDWTTGDLPSNYESTFDQWVSISNGTFYYNGPNAMAVYGGPVPLTAGNIFHVGNPVGQPGSDLIPDLMNGVVFNWGTRYYISRLDRAILADAGVPISVPISVPEPAAVMVAFGPAIWLGLRRPSRKRGEVHDGLRR